MREALGDSDDEISYGLVPLGPLLFRDDITRITTSTNAARAGNSKLSDMMKLKQLECNKN